MNLEEFEKKAHAFMEKRVKATNARVETSDNLKEFEEKAQRFMAKRSQPKVTENITSKEKSEQNENKISSLEKSKPNLNVDVQPINIAKLSKASTGTSMNNIIALSQINNQIKENESAYSKANNISDFSIRNSEKAKIGKELTDLKNK